MGKYQYQIIRYNWHKLPGAFYNVGLVFYSQEDSFYKCKILDNRSGVYHYFQDEKERILSLLKEFEAKLNTSFKKNNSDEKVENIDEITSAALPHNIWKEKLSCSQTREATSDNHEFAFEELFYSLIDKIDNIYSSLNLEYSQNLCEKTTIPHRFVVLSPPYKANHTVFSKIEFEHGVFFNGVDFNYGLLFTDCTFWQPLVFNNIKTTKTDLVVLKDCPIDLVNYSYENESIVFRKCQFHQKVIINIDRNDEINTLLSHLVFRDCVFENGFEISALNITKGNVTFENCTINGSFSISKLDLVKYKESDKSENDLNLIWVSRDISFLNNKVNGTASLTNINSNGLFFNEANEFIEEIKIENCKFSSNLAFKNSLFKEQITLTCIETQDLWIVGAVFEKTLFVYYYSPYSYQDKSINDKPQKGIARYRFFNAKFTNGIYIYGTEGFFTQYPLVDKINLNLSAELKGNIEFNHLEVGILNINGTNISANIYLQSLKINQIIIERLSNYAGLTFSGITASDDKWFNEENQRLDTPRTDRKSFLFVKNSNFGNAKFFRANFSTFKKVTFDSNILVNITTSNVKWFSPEQLFGFNIPKEMKNWSRKRQSVFLSEIRNAREVFRQLKYASEQQGDRIQSLYFKATEMGIYKKELRLSKPFSQERFILWLGQSNDFGLNWVKPALLALGSAIVFYILLIISHSDKLGWHLTFSKAAFHNTISVWWENKKMIPQMLNPAHSMDDLLGKDVYISGFTYTIDYCYRLILAYFIYQTIVAFRKYSK